MQRIPFVGNTVYVHSRLTQAVIHLPEITPVKQAVRLAESPYAPDVYLDRIAVLFVLLIVDMIKAFFRADQHVVFVVGIDVLIVSHQLSTELGKINRLRLRPRKIHDAQAIVFDKPDIPRPVFLERPDIPFSKKTLEISGEHEGVRARIIFIDPLLRGDDDAVLYLEQVILQVRRKPILFCIQLSSWLPGIAQVDPVYPAIGVRHPDRIVVVHAHEFGRRLKTSKFFLQDKMIVLEAQHIDAHIAPGDRPGRRQNVGEGQESPIRRMRIDGNKLVVADLVGAVVVPQQQTAVYLRQTPGRSFGAWDRHELSALEAKIISFVQWQGIKPIGGADKKLLIIYYGGITQALVQLLRIDMLDGIVIGDKIDAIVQAHP